MGEREKRKAKKKANRLFNFLTEHYLNPCGGTIEEQLSLRKNYKRLLESGLQQPGVLRELEDWQVEVFRCYGFLEPEEDSS